MEDESKHPEGESKQEFGTEDDGGENRGEEPEPEPEPEALSEEEGGGEAKDDAEPAAPRAVGADVRSVITDAVKRLNEMRADSGAEALALDARACEAADSLCVDMLDHDYVGHWDARGWSQVQRYALAGADGTVSEVVDGAEGFAEPLGQDADAIGREVRKLLDAAVEEGAEARKQLEAESGTHLAVGLAASPEKLRLCLAVITRAGEIFVGGWPGRELTLTGRVGRGVPAAVTVRSQPLPEAPEAAELQSRTGAGAVEGEIVAILAGEDLGVGEDPATFSCTAPLGALAPGAYTFTLHAAKDGEAAARGAAALADGSAPGGAVWEATRTVRTMREGELGTEEKEEEAGAAAEGKEEAEEGKEGEGKEEEGGEDAAAATGPIVILNVADEAAGLPEGASPVETLLRGEAVETDRDLVRCVGAAKGAAELAIAGVRTVRPDAAGHVAVPDGWELVDGGAVGRTEGAPSLMLRRVDEERGEDERAVLRVVLRLGRPDEGEEGAVARSEWGEEEEEEVELGVANASLVLCMGPATEEAAERAARREEEQREVARREEEERQRREEEELQRQQERVEQMRRQVEEAERNRDATISEHADLLQRVALSMQHSDSGLGGGEGGTAAPGAEGAGNKHGSADSEKRYAELLRRCAEERSALQEKQEEYNDDAMELQARVDEKEAKANEIQESFVEFKREIAKAAENSRTGKRIPPSIIKQFEITESKKEQELMRVRLRHLTLRAQLRKLEQALRKKEQLADGLHLIDFEQLKIENQTLQEKIEERNEELQKLRKKTTSTVQVLTHVKEKLQFVQGENQVLKQELAELDAKLSAQRDRLARSKQRRDRLRTDNDSLRQAQGFIYNRDLVFDFDDRQKEIAAMERKLERLKNRHVILSQKVAQR